MVAPLRTASARLGRVRAATRALAGATTHDQVIRAIFDEALAALGATSGALWLLDADADVLRWAGGAGVEATIPARFSTIPLTSGLPAVNVVANTATICFSSIAERDERWPQLAGTPSSTEATAALPLTVGDTTFGCLAVSFAERRDFDDDDMEFLRLVADQAAMATDRARLFAEVQTGRDLLQFVAEASAVLTGHLDPAQVLESLCRLAVPRLADWASAYLPEDGFLHRRCVWTVEHPEAAAVLIDRFPTDAAGAAPVAVAYRTGIIQTVPDITEATLSASSTDPAFTEALATLGLRSAVAVPVVAPDGRALAAITLAFGRPGKTYTPEILDVARDLARRAGSALALATEYKAQQRIATTLTTAVLPASPDTVPGVETAAVYAPVDAATGDVGGDWYESWPLPDGRLLLGIGDVAGHGLDAATQMAQLRHAARGWALSDPEPGQLLARLNELALTHHDHERFATALYGVLDPATGTLAWATAGHPPPVFVGSTTGRVREGPTGPPLGAERHAVYTTRHDIVTPGGALVLYTDGVTERRGRSLEDGTQRLIDTATAFAHTADLTDACRQILDGCTSDADRTDDCCIFVVRRQR